MPGVAGSTTVPTGIASQYRAEPADVIEVRVRRHQHVDGVGAFALQQRNHPALTGVEALIPGPGIDHDEMAVRRAQHRGVALAHVHKMQRQSARARLRHPQVGHQRDPHPRRPGEQQPARCERSRCPWRGVAQHSSSRSRSQGTALPGTAFMTK